MAKILEKWGILQDFPLKKILAIQIHFAYTQDTRWGKVGN